MGSLLCGILTAATGAYRACTTSQPDLQWVLHACPGLAKYRPMHAVSPVADSSASECLKYSEHKVWGTGC